MKSRKPDWLKIPYCRTHLYDEVHSLIRDLSLHTVCQEANCPNKGECYSQGTATFLLMGDQCTRQCTFCNVKKQTPQSLDPKEPNHIAEAVKRLHLRYVVLTSVTRDDLPDGGASVFASCIRSIRHDDPGMPIEVLIPDLQGNWGALSVVLESKPTVLNHNIETVPSLYADVRPFANYDRSIELIGQAKKVSDGLLTKSGMMVGLGETEEEIFSVLSDLRQAGCDLMVIGQYLPPSKNHRPLARYVTPDEFSRYKQKAIEIGFKAVIASPFARSSYQAMKMIAKKQ